jgi:hypothetical protein
MRRVGWLVVPIVLLILLGVAVFATRGQVATAFTLAPGDCFDIPADAQVGDVPPVGCTIPHDAEVFAVGDLAADPSPSGPAPYPGDAAVAEWVGQNCGASAQQAYLPADGSAVPPDLLVGYFFPSADAWTRGERQVTCYLHLSGTKLNAPLRAGVSSAPPS